MLLDYLSFCLLQLSQPHFWFSLIVLGYLNLNNRIYKTILSQMMLAILTSQVLKWHFHIPPLTGHSGWSFPSGHSQIFFVFCFCIMRAYPCRSISAFLIILLSFFPWAMVRAGHHLYIDVIAGYIYGVGSIMLHTMVRHHFIVNRLQSKYLAVFVGAICCALLLSTVITNIAFSACIALCIIIYFQYDINISIMRNTDIFLLNFISLVFFGIIALLSKFLFSRYPNLRIIWLSFSYPILVITLLRAIPYAHRFAKKELKINQL